MPITLFSLRKGFFYLSRPGLGTRFFLACTYGSSSRLFSIPNGVILLVLPLALSSLLRRPPAADPFFEAALAPSLLVVRFFRSLTTRGVLKMYSRSALVLPQLSDPFSDDEFSFASFYYFTAIFYGQFCYTFFEFHAIFLGCYSPGTFNVSVGFWPTLLFY